VRVFAGRFERLLRDSLREQLAERVFVGVVAAITDDRERFVAELRERLPAHPTGGHAVAGRRGDGELGELGMAGRDRLGDGNLLGVNAVGVVGVLDVAADDNGAVSRPESGADAIRRVGGVGVRQCRPRPLDEWIDHTDYAASNGHIGWRSVWMWWVCGQPAWDTATATQPP
jgi:hypothetical protein